MKKLALLALIAAITYSCNNKSTSIPIITSNNEHGQLEEIKLITNFSDSNYIEIQFYPNMEIESLTEFQKGKEKGKYYRWRENGNIALEAYKQNGKLDNTTREVHKNGRTMFEGKRKNNRFHGINNSFYPSGAIQKRWTRVNDKDLGKSIYYHENGFIKEFGEYTDSGYVLISKWDSLGIVIKTKNDTLTQN